MTSAGAGAPPVARPQAADASIWTRAYVLLCLVQFLGYAHVGLLTPTLPLYVASLGGSEIVVGLVLGAFSLCSFAARPFLGYWADRWNVAGILAIGVLILALSSVGLLLPLLWPLLLVNTVRGLGWAALNTGGNTLLAHLAPPTRRGEMSSYYNLFQSTTTVLTPPLGLWLLGSAGASFEAVFLLAVLIALVASVFAWGTLRGHSYAAAAPPPGGVQERHASRFYDRGVLLPSLLLLCTTLTHPAANAFVPLYALDLGIATEQVAWYYILSAAAAILGRSLFGRFSDRVGRGPAVLMGLLCVMLGLLTLSRATDLGLLILAGLLYSTGVAVQFPATLALAMDRVDPRRRGVGMASYSMAFQVGAGFGATIAGILAELAGYRVMFLVLTAAPAVGLMLVTMRWRQLRTQAG